VPLKKASSVSTRVVSPFIDTLPNSDAGREITDGIINALDGDDGDVTRKRRNTVTFLDYVAATDESPAFHTSFDG
jgi:hypothetical protein